MMELRHFRYFVAVAEELHFGRAARRLNVSQPPLSMQIAALEKELGLKLFDRDKRNVALTKAGEALLHRARVILASTDEAVTEAKRVDRGYEGKLTIGFMSSVMLVRISEVLRKFRSLAPSAEVDLRQMRSNEQYLAVINGEIDIGLVDIAIGSMFGAVSADDISVSPALHERLVVCVSDDHCLANRKVVSLQELADQPFITLTRQTFPSFFDTLLQLCQRAGFKPRIVQQVESMPVAISMASAGYGVAIVPELGRTSIRMSDARFITLEDEAFVDIHLISRTANRGALIERMKMLFAEESGV